MDCANFNVRCSFYIVLRYVEVRGPSIFQLIGDIGATLRVRNRYFRMCTVYAATGDLAGELNTGSLKYAHISMLSHSRIVGASGDRGAVNKLMPLPLTYISSADLLRFLRKVIGLIKP